MKTSSFVFNDKEITRAYNFARKHLHKNLFSENNDIVGKHICPTFKFELTETGIGTKTEIKCNICGITKDITDYNVW